MQNRLIFYLRFRENSELDLRATFAQLVGSNFIKSWILATPDASSDKVLETEIHSCPR